MRRRITRGLAVGVGLSVGLGAWGCASGARPKLTEAQIIELQRQDQARATEEFARTVERVVGRVASKTAEGDVPVCDLLALSGGGDYGAFGAGFLIGWGSVADPAMRRPDFDGVTGVSTGSLIAPFAFLDDDEALQQVDEFYRNPRRDWVVSRGWLGFLPMFPSFMRIPGLERDVRGAIDEAFLGRVARRGREGRALLVSATNLDLGTQRMWDLSEAAMNSESPEASDQFRNKLFASSAIPAVFPPIEIDGFLYADGGVTANVLLRLDPSLEHGFVRTWKRRYPDRPLPKIRYWIIINNQINKPPTIVQPRWPNIAGPSLATAIRYATLAEVRWLAAQADYTNAAFGTDIEVRSVAIPDDWRPEVPGDFKKPNMESLSDLGRTLGADPDSWTLWTQPHPAPDGDAR